MVSAVAYLNELSTLHGALRSRVRVSTTYGNSANIYDTLRPTSLPVLSVAVFTLAAKPYRANVQSYVE